MSNDWIPVISAFIGAIAGIGGAAAQSFFHSRSELKKSQLERERQLINLAVQAALEDFKNDKANFSGSKFPLSCNLYFHWQWLIALESNEGTPEKLESITNEALNMASASAKLHMEVMDNRED
jgi:hypothetical protein